MGETLDEIKEIIEGLKVKVDLLPDGVQLEFADVIDKYFESSMLSKEKLMEILNECNSLYCNSLSLSEYSIEYMKNIGIIYGRIIDIETAIENYMKRGGQKQIIIELLNKIKNRAEYIVVSNDPLSKKESALKGIISDYKKELDEIKEKVDKSEVETSIAKAILSILVQKGIKNTDLEKEIPKEFQAEMTTLIWNRTKETIENNGNKVAEEIKKQMQQQMLDGKDNTQLVYNPEFMTMVFELFNSEQQLGVTTTIENNGGNNQVLTQCEIPETLYTSKTNPDPKKHKTFNEYRAQKIHEYEQIIGVPYSLIEPYDNEITIITKDNDFFKRVYLDYLLMLDDNFLNMRRNIKAIILGNELKSINVCLFGNQLEDIVLNEGLENIEGNFENSLLKEFIAPDSLKSIPIGAFRNCIELERVELGKGLERIGNSAFTNCKKLEEANIPSGVKCIENSVFKNAGLRKIGLNKGLESISAFAFQGTLLQEVAIPKTVKNLGIDSFLACKELEILRVHEETKFANYELDAHSIDAKDAIGLYYFDDKGTRIEIPTIIEVMHNNSLKKLAKECIRGSSNAERRHMLGIEIALIYARRERAKMLGFDSYDDMSEGATRNGITGEEYIKLYEIDNTIKMLENKRGGYKDGQ